MQYATSEGRYAMNTPKDNHSVTGSPLMCLEFIIIHTLIWGFLLCVLFYVLNLFLIGPLFRILGGSFFFLALARFLQLLFAWPNVMVTALIVTIVRCFLRRTRVTLSGDTVIIRRLRHTDCLPLTAFIRQKTVESFVGYHIIGWVFRRRYLIFQNDSGKEVKYRLYEYSEKDLEQVTQLLTRVSRTEHLAEDDKTEIMMNAFQNEMEIQIDPQHLWSCLSRRLGALCIICLTVFTLSTYLFYRMLFIPPQYDSASILLKFVGYSSIALALGSFFLLGRTLWALTVNALLKSSCPQKIAFIGNMLQIDRTMYSANRIKQVTMNPPARKLPLFRCYQITLVTTEGTYRYWLGNTAGLGHGNWNTLCRGMQGLLVSCPAKLTYL